MCRIELRISFVLELTQKKTEIVFDGLPDTSDDESVSKLLSRTPSHDIDTESICGDVCPKLLNNWGHFFSPFCKFKLRVTIGKDLL